MKIYVRQTDSTNRLAKEQVTSCAPAGTVIWAGMQEGGRGQYGRTFASPRGGLYFSLILQPDLMPETLPLITLVTGLACRDVLFEQCEVETRIKWPNDLYLGEKKVGGILCENFFDTRPTPMKPTVIIGVGVNINTRLRDFPEELQPLVTTLHERTGKTIDLEYALDCFIQKITTYVEGLPAKKDSLLDRWPIYDYLLNRPLVYINGDQKILGSGLGLAFDGRYRILDETGQEHAIIGGQLRPAEAPDIHQ